MRAACVTKDGEEDGMRGVEMGRVQIVPFDQTAEGTARANPRAFFVATFWRLAYVPTWK